MITTLPDISKLVSLTFLGVLENQLKIILDLKPKNPSSLAILAQKYPLDLCSCRNVWLKESSRNGATIYVNDVSSVGWTDEGSRYLQEQCDAPALGGNMF